MSELLKATILKYKQAENSVICNSVKYPDTSRVIKRWLWQNAIYYKDYFVKTGSLVLGEDIVNSGIPYRLDTVVFPNQNVALLFRIEHNTGWSYCIDDVIDIQAENVYQSVLEKLWEYVSKKSHDLAAAEVIHFLKSVDISLHDNRVKRILTSMYDYLAAEEKGNTDQLTRPISQLTHYFRAWDLITPQITPNMYVWNGDKFSLGSMPF
ncbi:hypothetical protein [Paenibacillus sp. Leaf72]|uniref:hypothetical protein n=1 Tax=Paenibacillus sp. Leaf72 TaxID=1736234 RepID=UPI0006FE9120|nr:hypothetical protein [Paenibacillus sp. Leaf72]KQN96835.1 hypothetical protein ASF12_22450 [Paenibacillus sp. Leaf72]